MAKARKSKSTKNLHDLRDPLDYPETRIERYLKCIKTGDNTDLPSTVNTRIERYLYCIATGDNFTLPDHPETMIEIYLDAIATGNVSDLPHDPQDRLQRYLYAAAYVDSNLLPSPDYTRLEKYISSILGGITFVADQAPYLFRVSGGEESANVKHKELDTLVGATMAWNQMIRYTSITSYGTGVSFTMDDDKIITANGTADGVNYVTAGGLNVEENHKYFFHALNSQGSESTFNAYLTANVETSGNRNKDHGNGTIMKALSTGYTYIVPIYIYNGVTVDNLKSFPILIDLTLALGSTIADYVYSLETGTPGAGVAWLKDHGFCTKDYYAYDAGSLQSVCASAHVMRNASDEIIGNYPLDHSTDYRGLYKLDADNKLYADGDIYEPDGTVTRRYGIVDLGTLTWTYANNLFVSSSLSTRKAGSNNLICNKYVTHEGSRETISDKQICSYNQSDNYGIVVSDSSYTDAATFKTAMSGVYLVYELATTTTATVESFTNPQQVDRYGTEEYVDFPYFVEDRDVEVPVGHVTQYPQ